MVRLACAPNVAPNDAYRDSCSDTTSVAILSRSTPPYSSGTLVPSRPSAPHLARSSRLSAQSFCSRRSTLGRTSLSTNSAAVWPIKRCSSLSCSGVITVDGSVSSISHAPPLVVVCAVAVVIVVTCSGGSSDPPAAILSTANPVLLKPLKDSRRAHATADAHRYQPIAAAAPLHLVHERRRQLCARTPERMAQRNRAAVDVQLVRIDRQLLQTRQHLRRERFVQLDQIDLVERQAGDLQRFPDCRDRTDAEQLRRDACRRVGDKPRQRLQAVRSRVIRGGNDNGGGAVARLRRVACSDRSGRMERRT